MNRLLLFLLLLPGVARAQVIQAIKQDFTGTRGNVVVSPTFSLLPADTTQTIVAVATFTSTPGSLTVSPQPTIVRTGLTFYVRFATSATLPVPAFYYRVTIGTQLRFYGSITVGQFGIVPPPADGAIFSGLLSRMAVAENKLSGVSPNAINKDQADGYYKSISFTPDLQVANYAALTALGTVSTITTVTVVVDEKRGDTYTIYKLYPSGKRIFLVSLEDN